MTATSGSQRTSASLLARLHQWDDASAWDEFHRRYRKLILGLARGGGLSPEEAEEVTQDVLREIAERIATFESDPARGRFRGWLMNLTRWRIADKRRRRPRHTCQPLPEDNPDAPSAVETIPAPDDTLEREEREWQQHLLDLALDRLAATTNPKQLQAFQLYKLQQWPAEQVTRAMGLTKEHLHVIAHRFTRRLKDEVERLKYQLG